MAEPIKYQQVKQLHVEASNLRKKATELDTKADTLAAEILEEAGFTKGATLRENSTGRYLDVYSVYSGRVTAYFRTQTGKLGESSALRQHIGPGSIDEYSVVTDAPTPTR